MAAEMTYTDSEGEPLHIGDEIFTDSGNIYRIRNLRATEHLSVCELDVTASGNALTVPCAWIRRVGTR